MAVEIQIEYQGDLHCLARHTPSGSALTTDAPTDNGGRGEAFSPTDLVATALGSCMVTIMGLVAKRRNWDLTGTQIKVIKEMAAQPARRIKRLTVGVLFPARLSLTAADQALLEKAARECPVLQSLHPDVEVAVTYGFSAQ